LQRRFFPPTEYDLHGEEWEEVEGGESAENGESQEKPAAKETADVEAAAEGKAEVKAAAEGKAEVEASGEKAKPEDLPEVPTKDPSDEGPAPKKQKPSDDSSL
jgi:O-acetyl-ADP-ribose deacetylase